MNSTSTTKSPIGIIGVSNAGATIINQLYIQQIKGVNCSICGYDRHLHQKDVLVKFNLGIEKRNTASEIKDISPCINDLVK